MDFVEGLPNSFEKHVIFVEVYRFGKLLISQLLYPYTLREVAQSFMGTYMSVHRDNVFINQFKH